MRPEVLISRSRAVLTSLETQTGRRSGGPTGGCTLAVAEFLSGKRYNLATTTTAWEQRSELIRLGLDPYSVFVDRRVSRVSALDALLRQQSVEADALLISGSVKGFNLGTHLAAVVFDEGQPHHIVDSLILGGLLPVANNAQAIQELLRRFDESSLEFKVVATDAEKAKHMGAVDGRVVGVDVIPGVRIMIEERSKGFPL